jgi:hypothetical protein
MEFANRLCVDEVRTERVPSRRAVEVRARVARLLGGTTNAAQGQAART